MEPITAIANVVVTLLFSEALKEGGKTLGKGVSDQIAQLINTIHSKFQKAGTEGLIVRAREQPTKTNIAIVEAELVTQMEDDKKFTKQLEELIKQFEQSGAIRQVMVSSIKATNIEVESMTQKANKGSSTDQVMGADLEVGEDIKFGNLTQEG